MSENKSTRKLLAIINGPSGVGKSPVVKAVLNHYPELDLGKVVVYYSRSPRPVEQNGIDFHFRSRETIEKMVKQDPDRFITADLGAGFMALDLRDIYNNPCNVMLIELPRRMITALESHREALKTHSADLVEIFLSPISRHEIETLRNRNIDIPGFVADMMLIKLIRRAQNQGNLLTFAETDDLRMRAETAYRAMSKAHRYDYILINHDGEDSMHWRLPYPIGDAGRTLDNFVKILHRETPEAEQWEEGFLPYENA